MSISDDPHLAGRASILTGCRTAKTHIALAAIVSPATPTGSPASSTRSPVTASPVTASPAATAPAAPSSGKERLTFLRRHLLQTRAKRLALVVTPSTALATGVGCAGAAGDAGGRPTLATTRRRVAGRDRCGRWRLLARPL
jgi:hypothetical protein